MIFRRNNVIVDIFANFKLNDSLIYIKNGELILDTRMQIIIEDLRGDGDHYSATVISKSFAGINLELAGFIDQGTLSGSKFVLGDKGFDGNTLVDYGIGLRISTSIFGQPIYLRLDKPIGAKIDGVDLEKMNEWVFSFQKSI